MISVKDESLADYVNRKLSDRQQKFVAGFAAVASAGGFFTLFLLDEGFDLGDVIVRSIGPFVASVVLMSAVLVAYNNYLSEVTERLLSRVVHGLKERSRELWKIENLAKFCQLLTYTGDVDLCAKLAEENFYNYQRHMEPSKEKPI